MFVGALAQGRRELGVAAMRRFSTFGGKICMAVIVVAILAWAALAGSPVANTAGAANAFTDNDLYIAVSRSVANGDSYYRAIVELHRLRDYPLAPASVIRFPTLAYITGNIDAQSATIALLIANILAFIGLFPGNVLERAGAGVLLAIGGFMAFDPKVAYLHDLWAGLLIGLALIVYSDRRWWISVLAIAAAVAIREHAIIAAVLFGALALFRRNWIEVATWLVVGVLFALGTVAHYWAVSQYTSSADHVSRGWLALLGPKAFLDDVMGLTLLRLLPQWLAGPLALLPFLGWACAKDKRPLIVFGAYALLFCVFGRRDNFYWGFLVLPAYMAGLALVPRSIMEFWQTRPHMVGADGLEPPTLSV